MRRGRTWPQHRARSEAAQAATGGPETDEADRIIEAAWPEIAPTGWRRLSLAAIAASGRAADPARLSRSFGRSRRSCAGFSPHRRGRSGRAACSRGGRASARPGVRPDDAAIRRAAALRPPLEVLRRELARRPARGARRRRRRCCARCAGCSRRPRSRPAASARRNRGKVNCCGLFGGHARVASRRLAGPCADHGGARFAGCAASSGGCPGALVPTERRRSAARKPAVRLSLLRCQNFLHCKKLLDARGATADILGVVQRTINRSLLNGTQPWQKPAPAFSIST